MEKCKNFLKDNNIFKQNLILKELKYRNIKRCTNPPIIINDDANPNNN